MKVRFDYYKTTGKWYTSGEDDFPNGLKTCGQPSNEPAIPCDD